MCYLLRLPIEILVYIFELLDDLDELCTLHTAAGGSTGLLTRQPPD
jgi:hypothetical protein